MTISTERLLPCPFCGRAAYVSWPDSPSHMVEVGCPENWTHRDSGCPVGPAVADMDYHRAAEMWNRRSGVEGREAVIEECLSAIDAGRSLPIHSASVEYVDGVRAGADRAAAAIRTLKDNTHEA